MFLIGDIGNTEVKVFLFNSKSILLKKIRLSTNKLNPKNLDKNLKFLNNKKLILKKIVFCSVVPKAFSIIKKYIESKINLKCEELKSMSLNSLVNIKVNKKQIGSDRVANAISVIDSKKNFIVVDFGTATNFDVIIGKNYIGGILAPGVQLSLKNLSECASLIPKISLEKTKNVIGKNTVSAIRSGFYHGYSGLIDNIIKLIMKQTGKRFNIILTGGLAHLFKNNIKGKVLIKKDLTIYGVLKAAKK
tara:strand:+ start:962 stop:1702 length:741 start_codon:yes stop_codon:yes gene_type:complete